MSTTFGILMVEDAKIEDILLQLPKSSMKNLLREEMFETVAFRDSSGVYYRGMGEKFARILPEDTEVYALDNSQQGIETLRDLKIEIEHTKNGGYGESTYK